MKIIEGCVCTFVVVLMGLALLGSCMMQPPSPNDDQKADKSLSSTRDFNPDLEVSNLKWEWSKADNLYVVGTVRNRSDRTYSYVMVEVKLYDKYNNVIGSTWDNISDLDAGEVWRFRAIVWGDEDRVAYGKVASVVGF